MKHKVSILQTHEFSEQDLNDLMVTALEGGINYWCGKATMVLADDGTYKDVLPEDQTNINYASDIIGYGGSLVLQDSESDDEWTLTPEKFLNGIKKYCEENSIALNHLIDLHDAGDADCIVQYALFDEIVFS